MGKEFHTNNFLNNTNNRVESLNAKLKSVIDKNSTLQEFVEKLFVIIHSLENERDHKAVMSVLKNPINSNYTNEAECKYAGLLTKAAFEHVKNR